MSEQMTWAEKVAFCEAQLERIAIAVNETLETPFDELAQSVENVAAAVNALRAERDQLRADLAALAHKYARLSAAVNEWSGSCTPKCDSYGHDDECQSTPDLVKHIDALRADLLALVPLAKYGEAACTSSAELAVECGLLVAEDLQFSGCFVTTPTLDAARAVLARYAEVPRG